MIDGARMNTPSLSILLAEAERATADAVRQILESVEPPFGVRAVGTLGEFAEAARESPPDLALVDLATSAGRLEQVLARPPESGAFPVLVLAHPTETAAAVAAVASGALDFVLKTPSALADLPQAVQRVLREWSLRRANQRATEELRRLTLLVEERRKIAHDFNNILGTIVGNAELARADLDSQHPARESLDEILKAGLEAKQQIRTLLERPGESVHRPPSLSPSPPPASATSTGQTQAELPSPPPAATLSPSARRILYVDDDEMMLFLAVRTLERLGYGVQGCTSAAEALALCRPHPAPFDLVVTDLNMPDRSGLDLAADLLALHPNLPVVLSSGCVTPELEAAANRVGIRGILDKPTTAGELATVLGPLLPEHPP
jgi:DNA-binding NtrC family response regulator